MAAALALTLTACAATPRGAAGPAALPLRDRRGLRSHLGALIRALARENLPLRAVARDSGVIASDDTITPIGLWADCGTIGDDRLEGEALVSFTLFVEPSGSATRVQINSKMRTQAFRKGSSGSLRPQPVYPCASTGRFEANLVDTVRDLVKE